MVLGINWAIPHNASRLIGQWCKYLKLPSVPWSAFQYETENREQCLGSFVICYCCLWRHSFFFNSLWIIMIIFKDNEVMITKITDRIGCYVEHISHCSLKSKCMQSLEKNRFLTNEIPERIMTRFFWTLINVIGCALHIKFTFFALRDKSKLHRQTMHKKRR